MFQPLDVRPPVVLTAMASASRVTSVTGVGGVASTVTVSSSKAESTPSLTVNRRTYVPPAENDAVVASADGSRKTASPGPLVLLQTAANGPPGRPSSLAVPFKDAIAGKARAWSWPAATAGGRFASVTVIASVSMSVRDPSDTVQVMAYVPAC